VWSRVAQIALQGQIQHRRIRGAAVEILAVRLVEGAVCWFVLFLYFRDVSVSHWAVDLNFAAYALANVILFVAHRRQALTTGLVWLDIIANMLPIATAAQWSGGIYSPLLPAFVMKIGSYGLIYGADIGVQSLAAIGAIALVLTAGRRLGIGPASAAEPIPLFVRMRLTLAFSGFICAVACGLGMRTFRILQDRETRLAEAVGEKDRLYQESLRHQEDLRRLSRKMMEVSEQTMRQLARELHDDLGQALTAVKIQLGFIDRELPGNSPLRTQVGEARDQIGTVLQSVRNLAQLLRPAVLDDLGVVAAMQSYVASFSERTRIPVELETPPPETRLPRRLEVTLYRVLQEALTNVARHARAEHVRVQLQVTNGTVRLQIADDGCGFDGARTLHLQSQEHGMGVIGMRERVANYGGRFVIVSQPGAGTSVELVIRLAEPAAVEEEDESHAEDSRLVG